MTCPSFGEAFFLCDDEQVAVIGFLLVDGCGLGVDEIAVDDDRPFADDFLVFVFGPHWVVARGFGLGGELAKEFDLVIPVGDDFDELGFAVDVRLA